MRAKTLRELALQRITYLREEAAFADCSHGGEQTARICTADFQEIEAALTDDDTEKAEREAQNDEIAKLRAELYVAKARTNDAEQSFNSTKDWYSERFAALRKWVTDEVKPLSEDAYHRYWCIVANGQPSPHDEPQWRETMRGFRLIAEHAVRDRDAAIAERDSLRADFETSQKNRWDAVCHLRRAEGERDAYKDENLALKAGHTQWNEANYEDVYGIECSICGEFVEGDPRDIQPHTLDDCAKHAYWLNTQVCEEREEKESLERELEDAQVFAAEWKRFAKRLRGERNSVIAERDRYKAALDYLSNRLADDDVAEISLDGGKDWGRVTVVTTAESEDGDSLLEAIESAMAAEKARGT